MTNEEMQAEFEKRSEKFNQLIQPLFEEILAMPESRETNLAFTNLEICGMWFGRALTSSISIEKKQKEESDSQIIVS